MIEKNFIIWHDIINNSLSKHRSNNDNPLTPEKLRNKKFENHSTLLPQSVRTYQQN